MRRVDWDAVEAAIARSVRGNPSEADQRLCRDAHEANRKRYSKLHARVRDEIHEAIRRTGGVG